MKYLIYILFLSCLACSPVKKNDSAKNDNYENYLVKESNVQKNLKYLSSDELEGRKSGEKGGNLAADYLATFLQSIDVKPYFSSYLDTLQNYTPTTYNVVGFIEGCDPELKNEYVIIGAHYDHVGLTKEGIDGDFINNGANDDASGVVAVMEIARYFAQSKVNKRSILFCFFTAEEEGLKGSGELAQRLKAKNIDLYTMLNFEMIGVPMQGNHASIVTGFSKSNIAEKLNTYAEKSLVGYLPMEFQYQLFMRSDNFPFFLEFNVPCHAISSFDFKNFDYYHHVKDEYEKMDTKHMTVIIQDYIKAVRGMTNSATKEIQLKNK